MHEQYFGMEHVPTFTPGFFLMLKFRLFGKKITENAGRIEAIWYAYKGKLYMTKYSTF